jgi:hypothetical protein
MALLLKPRRHLAATGHLRLLRCLCDGAPAPPPTQTDTDASPPPLTRDETKLPDALHAALLDHHRTYPSEQVTFDPLPPLSEAISGLLPSPPPAHLSLHLFRRVLELRRGVLNRSHLAFIVERLLLTFRSMGSGLCIWQLAPYRNFLWTYSIRIGYSG